MLEKLKAMAAMKLATELKRPVLLTEIKFFCRDVESCVICTPETVTLRFYTGVNMLNHHLVVNVNPDTGAFQNSELCIGKGS